MFRRLSAAIAVLAGSTVPAPRPARFTPEQVYVADRLIQALGPGPKLSASYDAARTPGFDANYWANSDTLSADAANSPGVRATLRERARYESANNSFVTGLELSVSNDLIGTGPKLRSRLGSKVFNRQVEAAWSEWADEVDLAGKLRLARRCQIHDGEAVLLLVSNPGMDHEVKLDVVLVEADRLATPDLAVDDPLAIDGIRFDRFGNPTEYHVLNDHPGGNRFSSRPLDYTTYPASNVVHWFRDSRPGQFRGIPDITPAMLMLSRVRAFALATLSAAQTAANIKGLIQSDMSPDADAVPDDVSSWANVDVPDGTGMVLPFGWKWMQAKAEHPQTTYREFTRELKGEIARCVLVPRNLALGDSSDSNFSGMRADQAPYYRSIDVDREQIRTRVLNRVFRRWLREARLIDGLIPRAAQMGVPHTWLWPGFRYVEPLKEAQAEDVRLKNGTASYTQILAERGVDPDEHREELESEGDLRAIAAASRDGGAQREQPEEAQGDS